MMFQGKAVLMSNCAIKIKTGSHSFVVCTWTSRKKFNMAIKIGYLNLFYRDT